MCGFSLSNRILRNNPHDCGTHSGTFEVIMLGINVYSANASTRAILPTEQFSARFRDAFEGVSGPHVSECTSRLSALMTYDL